MYITKRKVNGKIYFSLEERYRDENGKVKSKSIHLGTGEKAGLKLVNLRYDGVITKEQEKEFYDYVKNNPWRVKSESESNFDDLWERLNQRKIEFMQQQVDPTYYLILGVEENSTIDEIKKRYRHLMKILHPDNGGDAKLFQLVKESYEEIMKLHT